ncbi:MAG: hypothetical protein KDE08_14910, partial [Rhodobacteraceae bacterium]|nr:hypothetical protein [Paracoccaceae bacterium]
DLPDEMRSDRVIATAWDATFALFDGTPSEADLQRLAANVPLQEAGRIGSSELSLSRANRSVRLFNHVVDRLAEGRQPDQAEIETVGYLMRTTAVYGSGKFGAAGRAKIRNRPEARGPFQIEMLSVWLTRAFTVDLVEHLAVAKGGANAVRLAPKLRSMFGVGNSTGLGMAPFLIRHPTLLNNWMAAREAALARVRGLATAEPAATKRFRGAVAEARENCRTWLSVHPVQERKLAEMAADIGAMEERLNDWPGSISRPWDALWLWAEDALSVEGQELLLALMLEPHGALIDDLADGMAADEEAVFHIDGSATLDQIRRFLADHYDWAMSVDYEDEAASARFWYVSEEKLEPRLGQRYEEPGADRELPLDIGRLAKAMAMDAAAWTGDDSLAAFLSVHPEHRLMARRLQVAHTHPYAEIRDNVIASDLLPIDLLRCKLAFFGATHFDPRSDRWVRISLFQNAPYPDELMEALQG